MRRRYFGGNSGYIGYSMSVNAMEAKNNGRYPKTQFKKVYSINDQLPLPKGRGLLNEQ